MKNLGNFISPEEDRDSTLLIPPETSLPLTAVAVPIYVTATVQTVLNNKLLLYKTYTVLAISQKCYEL